MLIHHNHIVRLFQLHLNTGDHNLSYNVVIICTIQSPLITEGRNQLLVGAIPFLVSSEYLGPPFEYKFRSTNQMDGISIAG